MFLKLRFQVAVKSSPGQHDNTLISAAELFSADPRLFINTLGVNTPEFWRLFLCRIVFRCWSARSGKGLLRFFPVGAEAGISTLSAPLRKSNRNREIAKG